VVELLGMNAFHKREIVNDSGQMRQERRDPASRFSCSKKGKGRTKKFRMALNEGEAFPLDEGLRAGLSVQPRQQRFSVPQVLLRWGASELNVDDLLGAR
jgi:hypothetical protein